MTDSGSSTNRSEYTSSPSVALSEDSGNRRKTHLTSSDSEGKDDDSADDSLAQRKNNALLFRAVAKVLVFSAKAHSDVQGKKEEDPDMRRRQSTDISTKATHGSRSRAPRKSLGAIYTHKDASTKTNNFLLSVAIREDIQKRQLLAKFQFLIRLRVLLHRWWKRHSVSEVSSTHPFYMQFQMINDASENPAESAINFKASYFKANKQMRMSQEAKRILTMKPQDRTEAEIYYAMIALRGIDSIADYPLRMQRALAAHGMFDSYGPKRIIVKQGHSPVLFYFILFGTVVVATLDKGSPYAKTRVTLRRGENFGELAIAHRTARQSTVITMEYTEFLTIDCDTYENIFMAGGVKTIHDPDHNRFMRSLYFLKEWPLEKLENNTKAMQFCFFRRNTVMVKDSNASDWIYIVKSGKVAKRHLIKNENKRIVEYMLYTMNLSVLTSVQCTSDKGSLKVYKKLVKCYPTVNKRTGNYREVANADGYMSFLSQENQYHRYAVYNHINIPPPLSPGDSDSDDGDADQSDEKENLLSLPLMQRVERLIRPRTASAGVIATYGESNRPRNKRVIRSAKTFGNRTRGMKSPQDTKDEDGQDMEDEEQGKRTLVDDYEGGGSGKPVEEGKKVNLLEDSQITHVFRMIPSKEEVEKQHKIEQEKLKIDKEKKVQQPMKSVHLPSDVNPHVVSKQQNAFITNLLIIKQLMKHYIPEWDICTIDFGQLDSDDSDTESNLEEQKKEVTAADLDPEFVLVQTLTKGQAFGLQQVFLENQPSMFLVSHGAECVMLNKKFYKDHVDPNAETRLKQQCKQTYVIGIVPSTTSASAGSRHLSKPAEGGWAIVHAPCTQISPYPTDEALQEKLRTRVNWEQYRKISLENLVTKQKTGKAAKLKYKDKKALFT